MSWYNKEQPTPFDDSEIPGIFFLDGDLLAMFLHQKWSKGQKFPQVRFPSDLECAIWESAKPETGGTVHIFGEMDLPYYGVCNEAYEHAQEIAEQCGYAVKRVGDDQLELWGQTPDEHYLLTYEGARLADIEQVKGGWEQPVHEAHKLMTDEIKAKLPPLYANEEKGLDAVAPVKYFSPTSSWTWYPIEFDGDDIFFGMVIGFEIELGLFSLSELKGIGGGLQLPIERDLHYTPKTLRELKAMHEGTANTKKDNQDIPF